MKIAGPTIEALKQVLLGDQRPSPYMSGPKLVQFFRQFGFTDMYPSGGGFPSRWQYVESRLFDLNNTPKMVACIEAAVDPRRFIGGTFDHAAVVKELNQCLRPEGFEIVPRDSVFRVVPVGMAGVAFEAPLPASTPVLEEFIHQQVQKCNAKLAAGDFDGAITNARSLLEAVLLDIASKIIPEPLINDGDLPKLYKKVRKAMRLDPNEYDIDSVQQTLRGLTTIVDGLSGMSNGMADRHAARYRPVAHHAHLAVNCANTLCYFLVESYRRQHG